MTNREIDQRVLLIKQDAEIERLKAANMAFSNEVSLSEREIHRLKSLLTRAADALEEEFGSPNDPAYGVKGPVHELIAELRKAAI